MSSSSFPLLRLPLVALAEIIKSFRLRQIVPLSLCSKRLHIVVRKYWNKPSQWDMNLRVRRDSEIRMFHRGFTHMFRPGFGDSDDLSIRVVSEDIAESWRTDRIGGKVVKFMETERELVTYWEDLAHGTKSIIDYIHHLFGASVHSVRISENITWPLDIVEERRGTAYMAVIDGVSDEILRNILTNYNPRYLLINPDSPGFQIENFNKRYDTFVLWFGEWLTLDNLYTLDCKEILCQCKKFNGAELNQYFKHVLAGGAPRLKRFQVHVRNEEENVMLAGIQELLSPIPGKDSVIRENDSLFLQGKLLIGEDSMQVTFTCRRDSYDVDVLLEICGE